MKLEIQKNGVWYPVDVMGVPAITYQQNTLDSLENRQQDYSQSFELPFTNRNAQLFDFINHGHHVTTMPYQQYPVRVFEAGMNIAREDYVLYITSVDETINVAIKTARANLIDRLQNFRLSYNGEGDYKNPILPIVSWERDAIIAANNNANSVYKWMWVRPSNKDTSPEKQISESQTRIDRTCAYSYQWLRPFIHVRNLLRVGFAELGITLNMDSITSRDYYKDLYISFGSLRRGLESPSDIAADTGVTGQEHFSRLWGSGDCNVTITWANILYRSIQFSDPANFRSVGFESLETARFSYNPDDAPLPSNVTYLKGLKYTAPINGSYQVETTVILSGDIPPTDIGPSIHFVLWKTWGSNWIIDKTAVFSVEIERSGTVISSSQLIDLKEGETLMFVGYASRSTLSGAGGQTTVEIIFRPRLHMETFEGNEGEDVNEINLNCAQKGFVNLYHNSPVDTLYDLFSLFVNAYGPNITIEDNTITLTSWDDIINADPIDWTGKVDLSRKNIAKEYTLPGWAKKNYIRFSETNGIKNESYIDVDNDNLPEEAEAMSFSYGSSVDMDFRSDGPVTRAIASMDMDIDSRQLTNPKNVEVVGTPATNLPNLYYSRQFNYVGDQDPFVCVQSEETPISHTAAYYRNSTGFRVSLEDNYARAVTTITAPNARVFNAKDIAQIFYKTFSYWILAEARYIKLNALLTTIDILSLDMLKPVRINYLGDKYYLRKISNRQGYTPTSIELIQIRDPEYKIFLPGDMWARPMIIEANYNPGAYSCVVYTPKMPVWVLDKSDFLTAVIIGSGENEEGLYQTYSISTTANQTPDIRRGFIEFTNGRKRVTVQVIQQVDNRISVVPTSLNMEAPRMGYNITIYTYLPLIRTDIVFPAELTEDTIQGPLRDATGRIYYTTRLIPSDNYATSTRSGTYTVYNRDNSAVVTLSQQANYLNITPLNITFPANWVLAQPAQIVVGSPFGFTYSTDGVTWYTVSGTGSPLTVNVGSNNTSTSPRSAGLRIYQVQAGLSGIVTITQQGKVFNVSPTTVSIGYLSSSTARFTVVSTFPVVIGNGNSQLSVSPTSFPNGGTGDVVITVLQANTAVTSRTFLLSASDGTDNIPITVVQSGAPASLTISPQNQAVATGGGTFSVQLSSNVNWVLTANDTWFTITSATSGSGSTTVTYRVNSNNTTSIRTGRIIASSPSYPLLGASVTITQAAPEFYFDPSVWSISWGTTSGSTRIVATGLYWTVSTDATWITVQTLSGTGNGTVNYTVGVNLSTSSRTGVISAVSGTTRITYTLTQEANNESLSISPTSATGAAAGGTGSFAVTSNSSWNAVSQSAGIAITSGSSGVGNGSVGYSFAQNTTGTARSLPIRVATNSGSRSATFTFNQVAVDPTLNVTPNSGVFGGGSDSKNITLISSSAWTATSNVAWLTMGSMSGTGNAALIVRVTPNPGAQRSGTITFTNTQGLTATYIASQQSGGTLVVSPSEIVANGGESYVIHVNSTSNWSAQSSNPIFGVAPTSGTPSDDNFTIYMPGATSEYQYGTVFVSNVGGASASVAVTVRDMNA